MRAVALPAFALLALLSACGDKEGGEGPERKTAAGEVLGGTISDAMLPLATVTSQSPPLRESASSGDDKAVSAADEPAGEDKPATSPTPSSGPSAAASASATPQAEN
jgi:hypothetical protein